MYSGPLATAEGNQMLPISRVCGIVLVLLLAAFSTGEAAAKRSKVKTNVTTRIILNWNDDRADVCFVHNSSGRRLIANVDAFPSGSPPIYWAHQSIPLEAIDDQKAYAWPSGSIDWHQEKCIVRSFQYR
jgi:hypothetical protein